MTSHQLLPALVVPFIAWRIYVRARRSVGRQAFKPARLQISVAILGTVMVVFAYFGLPHPVTLAALAGGVAVSAALAWWGLRLTRFEDTPQGKFYTPNTALGLAVSAMFIGRIAYRMVALQGVIEAGTAPQPFQSPLTFFLFGLSAGYYIVYNAGVLMQSHRSVPGTRIP